MGSRSGFRERNVPEAVVDDRRERLADGRTTTVPRDDRPRNGRAPRHGMMVEHRFECVHCGHRIHATGEDSDAARQAAREEGAAHLNDAHADHLERSAQWPDELAPEDLLADETAYGSLTGLLVPADDLLVCADCGYYFGHEADREPVGDAGLVCSACQQRRTEARDDAVAEAIEDFFR